MSDETPTPIDNVRFIGGPFDGRVTRALLVDIGAFPIREIVGTRWESRTALYQLGTDSDKEPPWEYHFMQYEEEDATS